MKILLAGPGTGKTTRVKEIIKSDFANANRILVLSFTNATVDDLKNDFADNPNVECATLHRFALKINHLRDRYILAGTQEENALSTLAKSINVQFSQLCEQLRCITFDAMIADCVAFLRANPVYGAENIGELSLLIVDEYQDFNQSERSLVDEISSHAAETIILGDDDQSIYGFKDADPDGIIALHSDNAVVKLDHTNKCYRCPDVVVERGQKLIRNNAKRVEKEWNPVGRAGTYATVQVRTQTEAINYVVTEVKRIQLLDPTRSILVLSPMWFCVDGLPEVLSNANISCVDFWKSGITDEDYQRVWWLRAIYTGRPLLNLLMLWKTLSSHFRNKLKGVLRAAFEKGFDPEAVLESSIPVFDQSLALYVANPPSLSDLVFSHPDYAELAARLNESDIESSVSSLMEGMNPRKDFDPASVNVMSIHKSKGLQADQVFILGLVEGVLPNDTKGVDTIEAQRRLLFVGITRARQELHLVSWVEWGEHVHKVDKSKFEYKHWKNCYYGRTSRFVAEME